MFIKLNYLTYEISAENEGTVMFYVGFYQPRDSVREIVAQMEEQHDIPVMIGSIKVLVRCCSLVFLDLQKLTLKNGITLTKELAKENVKVIGLISGNEELGYLLRHIEAGVLSLIEDLSLSDLVKGVYGAQNNQSILPPSLSHFLVENIHKMSQLEQEAFAHNLLKSGINFTRKEIEISYLLEKGLKNREIAFLIEVKESTVKVHVSHIYTKTGMKCRRDLVQYFKEIK